MPWITAGAMDGESAWLTVEAGNRRAIDFYLRHGFTRIGSTDFVIADQAYENYVMKIRPSASGWTDPRRDGEGSEADCHLPPELDLVGLAMRAERKVIDKIVDGLKFHS